MSVKHSKAEWREIRRIVAENQRKLRKQRRKAAKLRAAARRLPPPGITFPRRTGWLARVAARRLEARGAEA